MDAGDNWGMEQRLGWRMTPVSVCCCEFDIGEMACHAGHGDCAIAPLLTKVEIEGVVFDVLVFGVALNLRQLRTRQRERWLAHSLIAAS